MKIKNNNKVTNSKFKCNLNFVNKKIRELNINKHYYREFFLIDLFFFSE